MVRKLLKTVLTGFLGVSVLLGVPLACNASPVGDPDKVSPADITCDKASLTIVLPDANPDPADPGIYPYGDGSGYVISLSRIEDIDLTDAKQWDNIRKLTPQVARQHKLASPVSVTTTKDKQARFTDLPGGVYLATVQPPAVKDQLNPRVADFVVTAPLALEDGWHCDATLWAKAVPGVELPPTHPTTPETQPTPPATHPTPPVTVPTEPKKPPLPKTGVALAGIGGVALVTLGLGTMLMVARNRAERAE